MPTIVISPNEFLFKSNPVYIYMFFSVLVFLVIAGLCLTVYYVQLNQTKGTAGVLYTNIHKSYLSVSVAFAVIVIVLTTYMLIRFFRIFPIGTNFRTTPSIIMSTLLTVAFIVMIIDVIALSKDLNSGIYCAYGQHLDPITVQCLDGCNGDDTNCSGGSKCRGNQCCPPENLCGADGCCSPGDCYESADGSKACCPEGSICKNGTTTKCCTTGTVCDEDSGECVSTCGTGRCGVDQLCNQWNPIDASTAEHTFCPLDDKIYDPNTQTLSCCFPKPSAEGCVPQAVVATVPASTDNYTSCFSTGGLTNDDITQLMNASSTDEFAAKGRTIMLTGNNANKAGYLCGYDEPLKRGFMTTYSGTGCPTSTALCYQNDATTKTERMMATTSGTDLYCKQLITCNDTLPSSPFRSVAPNGFTQTEVICDDQGVCTTKNTAVPYKNPDEKVPTYNAADKAATTSTSYLFQSDCTSYPDITNPSAQSCDGTVMANSEQFQCAAETSFKYIIDQQASQGRCAFTTKTLPSGKEVVSGYYCSKKADDPNRTDVQCIDSDSDCTPLFADMTNEDDRQKYAKEIDTVPYYAWQWNLDTLQPALNSLKRPENGGGSYAMQPVMYFGDIRESQHESDCNHNRSSQTVLVRMCDKKCLREKITNEPEDLHDFGCLVRPKDTCSIPCGYDDDSTWYPCCSDAYIIPLGGQDRQYLRTGIESRSSCSLDECSGRCNCLNRITNQIKDKFEPLWFPEDPSH